MKKNENILVVLPARGNSKRIRKKNIHPILGKPMIYWPIMELRKIFTPEEILVSTDSDEIAEAVEELGLRVPLRRPVHLSDDHTGTVPVITHALEWFEKNVKRVDYVLAVYPTAVMLLIDDILDAFEMLRRDKLCDSVLSACTFPYPVQRAVFENADGYAEMFQPKYFHSRSQDLVESKHDAGQFSISRAGAVRKGKILTNSRVRMKLLNRNNVIDIDTMEDLEVAEEKLRIHNQRYDKKYHI